MKDLQSSPLPLGYGALMRRITFSSQIIVIGETFVKRSRLLLGYTRAHERDQRIQVSFGSVYSTISSGVKKRPISRAELSGESEA